jgi:hypothetical protein
MNSRIHAILDYATGLLLLAAPYILGFANGGPEQVVPQLLGAMIILLSLTTSYELSIAKIIPYRVHLIIDIVQALFLMASPWLLGYADRVWLPHVAVGIFELVIVTLSWRGATRRPSAT